MLLHACWKTFVRFATCQLTPAKYYRPNVIPVKTKTKSNNDAAAANDANRNATSAAEKSHDHRIEQISTTRWSTFQRRFRRFGITLLPRRNRFVRECRTFEKNICLYVEKKQNKTKQKPKKRYGRLKKKIKQRSRCGRKKRIKKNYTKNKQINKIRHSDRTEKRLRLGCFVDAERINGCAADTHRKPVDVNVKISVVLYDERWTTIVRKRKNRTYG